MATKTSIILPEIVTPTISVVEPETKVAEEVSIKLEPQKPLKRTAPSDWKVEPLQDGNITAYNNETRETFSGSIADFNKLLRG